MTTVRIARAAGLGLVLSCLLVGCKDPSPDKASLRYSEDLYDSCVQCHGENGEGRGSASALVGGSMQSEGPPLRSIELTPGKHTVEIRNASFPIYLKRVDVRPGDRVRIRHRFQ